jgi:hypothetical protein
VTTTQTLRPNSDDITYGTVIRSTGATYSTLIDDAPADDATHITSAQWGAGQVCGLTNLSALGGAQRIRQVRMRVRCFHSSADVGHVDQVDGRLRDNLNGKTVKVYTFGTSSNTAVEQSSGWYTADPNGAAWTEAFCNRMQVHLAWRARSTGVTQLRITEAYVDVEVHDQPVVSAVTVTGATTTTTPDVGWTYTTTDDSGGQTRYQVKVFTSAQYGVAGFDPATSPNTWDSGVLSGPGTTVTVGVNLLNGTTYKAYVRAARDWPGPAGPLWYSAWAASSATAIALTPPPAPTITVSQQTGLPGYRNLIRVTAPINLLTLEQSSLEGGTTTGWGGSVNATVANSTAFAVDGTHSLEMSSVAAGTMQAVMPAGVRVEPGAAVTAMGVVRAATVARNVRIAVFFADIAGGAVGTTFSNPVLDSTSVNTTVSVTSTAPATAYTVQIVLEVASTGGAAEKHRWDILGVWHGTSTTWTPGGYAGSSAVVVYRSLRISPTIGRAPARNWVHPQLFSAGALTLSTDGFYPRQANDSVAQLPMDRAAPESPGQVSAGMVEWTIRVGAFSYLDIGAPDGVATDGQHPYLMPAVPGLPMTASVWLWADAAFTARLAVIFVDRFNAQVGSTTLSASASLTTTEQKVSVAATGPAGCVFARFAVEDTAGVAGFRVYAAMPRWRVTADPDEAWPGQVFAWSTETVRPLTSTAVVDGQNDVAVYDHEAPPGRPVLYWARVTALTSSGQATASLDGTAVHVYQTPPARCLIGDPWQPENAAVCNIQPGDTAASVADATELHPSGRDGDPVLVTAWTGRTRSYDLSAYSDLEYYRLVQLLPSTRQLYWKWPEGGITYGYVTSWSPTRTRPGYYKTIAVQVLETARPA